MKSDLDDKDLVISTMGEQEKYEQEFCEAGVELIDVLRDMGISPKDIRRLAERLCEDAGGSVADERGAARKRQMNGL